jgi:pyruvate dehydrogenase E2 component (dihydrolipoamide acetyltransferase)
MAHEVKLTMDGLLINWLKDVGESVSAGDIIAEFEADKATVEVEAGADGTVLEHRAESGDEVDEGTIIAVIGAEGEASAPASDDAPQQEEASPEEASATTPASSNGANGASMTDDGRIKASPLAKRIAADKGIDLSQVAGTGPSGRIVKADVENFDPSQAKPAPKKQAAASAPAPAGTVLQTWGKVPEEDVEVLEITRMRRAIADGTVKSTSGTPHFFVTVEVDVEPMLALRKEINAGLVDEGIKISVNDMLIKALALGLKKFPNLNTHYYGDKLIRHNRINIGISVALPDNGLVNVVCHDADKISLSEMASSNKAMYDDVRNGQIKAEYIRGGTFTISNLGPFNVKEFSAIIDSPQAGIVAVASSQKVPVVLGDGSIGVGTRMNMTLSIDHRVSDGAEGAQFMNYVRDLIENPMRLLV